jgi:glucuronoarabinoxylan endo-1,4-beta-xylanase
MLVAGCGGGSPGVASSGSSSTTTVAVDAARQYQRIAGFGVSEGFGLDAAHVTLYLTDTTHQLSAQTPITVTNSAFTATLPPRSLVTYQIRS